MNISFDTTHAAEYGVNEAILIRYFQHWIRKNRSDGVNCKYERTWCYTTHERLAEHFKFMTPRQIKYAMQKLVDSGVLRREQPAGHDRTTWYSFLDEGKFEILDVSQPKSQGTKTANPSDKIVPSTGRNPALQGTKLSHDSKDLVKEELIQIETSPPPPQGEIGTDLFGKPIGFTARVTFTGKRKTSKPEHLLTYEELLLKSTPEELAAYRDWVKRRREKHGAREVLDESKAKYCLQTMLPPLLAAGHKRLDIFKAAAFGGWMGFHEPPIVKPNRNNPQEISGESRYRKKEQERQEVDEQRRQRQQNPMTPEVQAMVKNVLNGTGTHTA
jgi:hypothetical protein